MTFTLRAAAAVLAVAGGIGSAGAADLGGNCCADLEERIAELEATTARKGNRKVSLTLYGRVNQAVMWWDDQTEDNVYVVNNKTSTTLFGLEGAAAITSDWSAGYRIEIETASANSDFVDQGFVPGNPAFIGVGDEGRQGLFTRHAYWWIDNKRLGRVSVGQQSNATDNIAEMDLSRTAAISLSSVETWNEGFFLRDANTGQAVLFPGVLALSGAGVSIMGDLFRGNLDGGRGNFVRYDSPVLAGFILSTAWGEDDDWDVALRYAGSFHGLQLAAGIGYHRGQVVDTDNVVALLGGNNFVPEHEEVVGSVSVLHEPTGIFVTFAAGDREWLETPVAGVDIRGENYFYGKTGFLRKWLPLGDTVLYGEYYRIWDVGLKFGIPSVDPRFDEEAEAWGLGVVQHIDAAAMEVYLAYRRYTADDITDFTLTPLGATLNDHDIEMDMVMGGARIRF